VILLASFLAQSGAVFLAGLVSVASPCVLPLVPVYLAAATTDHATHAHPSRPSRAHRGSRAARFVAGFSVVFAGLGAFSGAVASAVPAPSQARIAGLVLCFIGLSALGLLPPISLGSLSRSTGRRGSPFFLGVVFAVAATPCTTAVLGLSLAAAASSADATRGAFLLACYGAGLAAAFFAVGLGLGRAAAVFCGLRSWYWGVSKAAAGLTVAFGVLFALGQGWRFTVTASHVLHGL
jgi:cytochrome c-type biogenesis protein